MHGRCWAPFITLGWTRQSWSRGPYTFVHSSLGAMFYFWWSLHALPILAEPCVDPSTIPQGAQADSIKGWSPSEIKCGEHAKVLRLALTHYVMLMGWILVALRAKVLKPKGVMFWRSLELNRGKPGSGHHVPGRLDVSCILHGSGQIWTDHAGPRQQRSEGW